ncbi:DUF2125 domain-containing protein [Marimonas sp. MJW-29]|uniref:DUF2125 domain-containing protein n=1 Tax=Sulfitobacter sediminis TaxID=3234186 RepID=A0ABV3RM90_9RHOB
MRRLVWIVVVLAVLWCGWWWVSAQRLERGITDTLVALEAEGWRTELGGVAVSGFPGALEATVTNVALSDDLTGTGLAIDRFDLSAPAYWPGDMTLSVPDRPVVLIRPTGPLFLHPKDAAAVLSLHPGPSLELVTLSATSAGWALETPEGNVLSATELRFGLTQDAEARETYKIELAAASFVPGEVIRTAMALPDGWPQAFEAFWVDVRVTFDRPLDRRSLDERVPQLRQIAILEWDLAWGDLRATAEGAVQFDAGGVPQGEVLLRVERWRDILDRAATAGVVDAGQRVQVELVLNALANLGGSTETLNLPVAFRGGEMFLGPILLGPAPRLVLN